MPDDAAPELEPRDDAGAFDAAVRALLWHRSDAAATLDALVARDPTRPASRALRGFALALLGRAETVARAREELRAARRHPPASARDAALVEALGGWLGPDPSRAVARLRAHLVGAPRDAIAVKLAHACAFVLGDVAAMRAATEDVLPHWDEHDRYYPAVLGCHAFALCETGARRAAETLGRRAVELDPGDPWAGHAVAHVFEMESRPAEGVAWLRALAPHHTRVNNLAFHLAWHEALFALARGRHGEVLALYDARVRPTPTDDYRDVSNATTLLWRLERERVDVGARWDELADVAERRAGDGTLGFAVVHYGLALVGAGRLRAAEALIEGHRARLEAVGPGSASLPDAVVREVALPVVEGMLALARGEAALALRALCPVHPRLRELGGSDAQRDVFTHLLVEAAIAAGAADVARAVLSERARGHAPDGWAAAREARLPGAGRCA